MNRKQYSLAKGCLSAAAAVLLAGCSGRLPSEQEGYRLACEALARDAGVPSHAVAAPFEDAGLYIAKNAGCVVLPYRVDAGGQTESASYTVWLKRVARTWQTERSYITPTYPEEASSPGEP